VKNLSRLTDLDRDFGGGLKNDRGVKITRGGERGGLKASSERLQGKNYILGDRLDVLPLIACEEKEIKEGPC
jgi:hypothetical protein